MLSTKNKVSAIHIAHNTDPMQVTEIEPKRRQLHDKLISLWLIMTRRIKKPLNIQNIVLTNVYLDMSGSALEGLFHSTIG